MHIETPICGRNIPKRFFLDLSFEKLSQNHASDDYLEHKFLSNGYDRESKIWKDET